ncbi:hypothetical protein [Tsuneonella troitsensis]|uniref:hypothetical protein n=1 Tax=Tsuneonella troitsensis TaxID=292222 RepID=UPI0019D23393
MTSAAASPADEAVAQSLDTPHHRRIAWCAFDRFGCQSDQFIGVEARSEALQSLRCDGPVAIATRAFQQIEVMIEAFLESGAKFGMQRRILARSRRKRRIECPELACHRRRSNPRMIKTLLIMKRIV